MQNWLGFGAADWIALFLTALTALLLKLRGVWLAARPRIAVSVCAALPVALRLAPLPLFPPPQPVTADDFAHLLVADTLRHGRLANPVHPMHTFFETLYELQEPSYASIYPPGQGIALAIGWTLFGSPWAGVLLSIACLGAFAYWAMRAWVNPNWALFGGIVAGLTFGPLTQWMNSYWGGAVSACAGCLVFGGLPRLARKQRYAVWFAGAGLAIQLLSRPFEFLLLAIAVGSWLVFTHAPARAWLTLAVCLLPAAALMLLLNRAVTGSFLKLPYAVSRYQYGVPASFTFQPNPVPHRPLTHEQQLDYEVQCAIHGERTDTPARYLWRLLQSARYYRFFFFPPFYVAIAFFLVRIRERRFAFVLGVIALFAAGTNFYPYFYPHYIAAEACLFLIVIAAGLEGLSLVKAEAAHVVAALGIAFFVFWYSLQCFGNQPFSMAAREYQTWVDLRQQPGGRAEIEARLSQTPGQQLVFVRYGPAHQFDEWVYNGANIDAGKVVWARDLGPQENAKLRAYYPRRTAWLAEPDGRPPALTRY